MFPLLAQSTLILQQLPLLDFFSLGNIQIYLGEEKNKLVYMMVSGWTEKL